MINYLINEKGFANYPTNTDPEVYRKYLEVILKLYDAERTKQKVLDVGCGVGVVIKQLFEKGLARENLVGIDVGEESISLASMNKVGTFMVYDGHKMPFADKCFDIVGSNNVLEHTDNPESFLIECVRVLKIGGHLIIVCPNFLSITNSYHPHTKGALQKFKNLLCTCAKIFTIKYTFVKMPSIQNEVFSPDDDAIVVTNPIDLLKWAKSQNLTLVSWSSQQRNVNGVLKILDRTICKVFLGACFFVFKK